MTGKSRCDYFPLGSRREHRCTNKALVRVLGKHEAGIDPEHKDRCLAHAVSVLDSVIVAFRDPDSGEWQPTY
ncbi:MAG: hypothetical protein O6951_10915 [Actinobacteria bacterium]|nr:hypothetical protein [Actinomycetota bacterium]